MTRGAGAHALTPRSAFFHPVMDEAALEALSGALRLTSRPALSCASITTSAAPKAATPSHLTRGEVGRAASVGAGTQGHCVRSGVGAGHRQGGGRIQRNRSGKRVDARAEVQVGACHGARTRHGGGYLEIRRSGGRPCGTASQSGGTNDGCFKQFGHSALLFDWSVRLAGGHCLDPVQHGFDIPRLVVEAGCTQRLAQLPVVLERLIRKDEDLCGVA